MDALIAGYIETIEVPVTGSCVPNEHPIITSIVDVPDDQGGWVTVNFTRSYHDTDILRNV